MDDKYQVVVIGAGLGGLSAAAFLASKGIKVLLLERHVVPGGYAQSFVRGRYEFEVSLHALSGMGTADEPGSTYRYLEKIGVTRHIELARPRFIYRSVTPGLDLRLPWGRKEYEEVLCDAFPAEADGIHAFLDHVFELYRAVAGLQKAWESGDLPSLFLEPWRLVPVARNLPLVLKDVLARYVGDPLARAVLGQYWGYFGLPPSRVSYLYYAMALATYVDKGATYVKGRSQALSNAFVAAIQEKGGDVVTGCGVERILVRGGRAAGVVTQFGDSIMADAVISNADPVTTCNRMIGPGWVPRSFYRRFEGITVGPGSFVVYMGIDAPPGALGVEDHEVFVNSDHDLDSHHEATRSLADPRAMVLCCYNTVCPDISPVGTTMISLTSLYRGEPWYDLDPNRYQEVKHRIADSMIRTAESLYPDVRRLAETISVSTPITNMRFTRALGGSIYGFDQPPHFSSVMRMGHKGPLDGLFFAGAWTQPGGGFEPCIISGRMAGAMAIHAIRRRRV